MLAVVPVIELAINILFAEGVASGNFILYCVLPLWLGPSKPTE
jgi:hypothetical protein